jgi:hypothetical protein
MRSSIEASNFWNFGGGLLGLWDDVGREKFGGGLDGGEDFGCRGDELHPKTVAVSEVAACGGELLMGESGRYGPSKGFAGDSGRLPGIVARPPRVTGGDEWITLRIS